MRSLLMLCGLLCDEAVWADIPARLADLADVGVISFPGTTTIHDMARAVLCSAPPTFALAGHSMGGRVALEVWRCAPQRVTGLGLLNTSVLPARPTERASRKRLVELARKMGMRALARQWLPPLLGAAPARITAIMPTLQAMVERATPDGFAAQSNALLNRPDARSILPSINVPTLVLSGANDTWSSIAQHADMQRRVAHATLIEIAGAGHMAPIERPDAVARALRRWLSAV